MIQHLPLHVLTFTGLMEATRKTLSLCNWIQKSRDDDPMQSAGMSGMSMASGKSNGMGPSRDDVTPGAGPPFPESRLGIEIEDWDILFRAIQERLRLAVGEVPAGTLDARGQDAAANQIRTSVLECVSALERLHAAVTQERSQRR